MEPAIIFEDNHILVLDKPSGWIVNEADTTKNTPVIQTWLRMNFDYEIVGSREERSGIVHRLDKETSGVLLVAKTQDSFRKLQKQFKERVVEKTYTALVRGKVEPKVGDTRAPVGRLPWNRERFGVLPGGREAITQYKVLGYYQMKSGNGAQEPEDRSSKLRGGLQTTYSLLELFPKTGRTHQIRIHLKYLGHPIVSDEFYAGRKTARKERIWCPRLFLHAGRISFLHPETKKTVTFESELPQDLKISLSKLEKISSKE